MSDHPIAAVGVVVVKEDRILLIKKGRGLFTGQLCIPGGKIEMGESMRDTVHREIREELNITVSEPEFITCEEHIERDERGKATRHFVFFNFKVDYISGDVVHGDDASAVVPVSRDALSGLSLSPPTGRTFRVMGYVK